MPRITQAQKGLNREKIVRAASEGFKRLGVDGVGIQDLMHAAGMTNGGFYNHFPSKDDLALEVYRQGFADSLGVVAELRTTSGDAPLAALHAIIDTYVTTEHRDHPETGCPSAALPVDAGRHGAAPQAEYREGLEGYFGNITELLLQRAHDNGIEFSAAEAREQAVALFSQMVGALVVSRAVVRADPALSDEILAANKHVLKQR